MKNEFSYAAYYYYYYYYYRSSDSSSYFSYTFFLTQELLQKQHMTLYYVTKYDVFFKNSIFYLPPSLRKLPTPCHY